MPSSARAGKNGVDGRVPLGYAHLRMKRLAIPVLALACLVSAAPAGAQEKRYELTLRAAMGCPSESALVDQVSRRSNSLHLGPGGTKVTVDVALSEEGFYSAEVRLPGRPARVIRGRECADVTGAMAFIIVVSLEPERARSAREPDAAESTLEEDETSAGPASTATPVSRSTAIGVMGGVRGALAPQVMPTVGAFVATRREGTWLALGARGALFAGRSSEDVSPEGRARFTFLGAELDACPLALGPVSGCLGIEGGSLQVQTTGPLSVGSTRRLWLSGHGAAALSLSLSGSWMADVVGGATFPLTRDRFVVERVDGSLGVVHEPGLSAYAVLGLGYRL